MVCFVSIVCAVSVVPYFFFFNDTATTEIYTLSLHDALPIFRWRRRRAGGSRRRRPPARPAEDRKSTRLNSSHLGISYAVFCLKKKNINSKEFNNVNTKEQLKQQNNKGSKT